MDVSTSSIKNCMQVRVSTPDFSDIRRYLNRAGGSNEKDWLRFYRDATNCTTLCTKSMLPGGLGYGPAPYTYGADPFYLKYFDGFNFIPLNGKRIQHVSQIGTVDLDPELPQMNITDVKSCLRMLIPIMPKEWKRKLF